MHAGAGQPATPKQPGSSQSVSPLVSSSIPLPQISTPRVPLKADSRRLIVPARPLCAFTMNT